MKDSFRIDIPEDMRDIIDYDPNSPEEQCKLQELRELVSAHGAPQKVADEFYKGRIEHLIDIIRSLVEKRMNAWATLQQVVGDEELNRRISLAKRCIFHFGGEDLYRKFLATKIPVDPLLIDQFAKIGEQFESILTPEDQLPTHIEGSEKVHPWEAIRPPFITSAYGTPEKKTS